MDISESGSQIAEKLLVLLDDRQRQEQGGSPASYAIRFAAGFEGIRMVLSGMSDMVRMEDNISYMKDFQPLSDRELAAVRRGQEIFQSMNLIPCTSCRYCVAGCPQHLHIRELLETVANEFENR